MKTQLSAITIVMFLISPVLGQSAPVLPSEPTAAPAQMYAQAGSYGPMITPGDAFAGQLALGDGLQRVFIVPNAKQSPEDFSTIIEDMHVMCRIFDKMGSSNVRGLPAIGALFPQQGAGQTEALYLQGYGLVFFVKVPFTLDLSEPQGNAQDATAGAIDPLWESTREETLYGRSGNVNDQQEIDAANRNSTIAVKERVVELLKHASNIRSLKPDDKIIVRITGQGTADRATTRSTSRRAGSAYGDVYGSRSRTSSSAGTSSGPATLIARARKSDIDGYGAGKLSLDQFKSKVEVIGFDLDQVAPLITPPQVR